MPGSNGDMNSVQSYTKAKSQPLTSTAGLPAEWKFLRLFWRGRPRRTRGTAWRSASKPSGTASWRKPTLPQHDLKGCFMHLCLRPEQGALKFLGILEGTAYPRGNKGATHPAEKQSSTYWWVLQLPKKRGSNGQPSRNQKAKYSKHKLFLA